MASESRAGRIRELFCGRCLMSGSQIETPAPGPESNSIPRPRPSAVCSCACFCAYVSDVCTWQCVSQSAVAFMAQSSPFYPSQGSLSLGISVAAPAIIIPCLLLIADTAGSQQEALPQLSALPPCLPLSLSLFYTHTYDNKTFSLSFIV